MKKSKASAHESPSAPQAGASDTTRVSQDHLADIQAARAATHETRRPTVRALEDLLFDPLPVLDHGFVRVVDYMGDDSAIVQAARVSYGTGTRKVHEDRGLVRYLMRHRHTTPFEMCEIKLHCKLPIFVARQWIRHRTACLEGATRLVFDLPGARRRGRRQSLTISVERFHRLWHEGQQMQSRKKKPLFLDRVDSAVRYTIPELSRLVERREEDLRNLARVGRLETDREGRRIYVRGAAWHAYAHWHSLFRIPWRGRIAGMHLRMCNEESGAIEHTHVTDIWETGIRPVFRVTLENGYSLDMTLDHRCLTERGWLTLQEATRARLRGDGGVIWYTGGPAFAVNGTALYKSREWLAEQRARGLDIAEIASAADSHKDIHRVELELQFLRARENGRSLATFWADHPARGVRPEGKRGPAPTRLARTFARVVRIDYVGLRKTYDLAVSGPFHNFVANGLIVHNSVNEYSARYSILDREFYIPAPSDLGVQSTSNRQGRGERLTVDRAAAVLGWLRDDAARCYEHYQQMLNRDDSGRELQPGEPGLARELARMNLTLNYYTQWYWKIDLYNLLHFLSLRMDEHAQSEIRAYANVIGDITKRWVPHAWEAFVDFRLGGTYLSRAERMALETMLSGQKPNLAELGLSKREQEEFRRKFRALSE